MSHLNSIQVEKVESSIRGARYGYVNSKDTTGKKVTTSGFLKGKTVVRTGFKKATILEIFLDYVGLGKKFSKTGKNLTQLVQFKGKVIRVNRESFREFQTRIEKTDSYKALIENIETASFKTEMQIDKLKEQLTVLNQRIELRKDPRFSHMEPLSLKELHSAREVVEEELNAANTDLEIIKAPPKELDDPLESKTLNSALITHHIRLLKDRLKTSEIVEPATKDIILNAIKRLEDSLDIVATANLGPFYLPFPKESQPENEPIAKKNFYLNFIEKIQNHQVFETIGKLIPTNLKTHILTWNEYIKTDLLIEELHQAQDRIQAIKTSESFKSIWEHKVIIDKLAENILYADEMIIKRLDEDKSLDLNSHEIELLIKSKTHLKTELQKAQREYEQLTKSTHSLISEFNETKRRASELTLLIENSKDRIRDFTLSEERSEYIKNIDISLRISENEAQKSLLDDYAIWMQAKHEYTQLGGIKHWVDQKNTLAEKLMLYTSTPDDAIELQDFHDQLIVLKKKIELFADENRLNQVKDFVREMDEKILLNEENNQKYALFQNAELFQIELLKTLENRLKTEVSEHKLSDIPFDIENSIIDFDEITRRFNDLRFSDKDESLKAKVSSEFHDLMEKFQQLRSESKNDSEEGYESLQSEPSDASSVHSFDSKDSLLTPTKSEDEELAGVFDEIITL